MTKAHCGRHRVRNISVWFAKAVWSKNIIVWQNTYACKTQAPIERRPVTHFSVSVKLSNLSPKIKHVWIWGLHNRFWRINSSIINQWLLWAISNFAVILDSGWPINCHRKFKSIIHMLQWMMLRHKWEWLTTVNCNSVLRASLFNPKSTEVSSAAEEFVANKGRSGICNFSALSSPWPTSTIWQKQSWINHRGYAVVCLSPVIEAVGVTSIPPHTREENYGKFPIFICS